MIFKTHKENIPQIEATLEAFGVCFFHGDGNMYTTQQDSDFRKDFTNPNSEESTYRIKFTKGENIPQTVEDLNKVLMDARNREILQDTNQLPANDVKTITVKKKEGSEGTALKVGKPYAQQSKDELIDLAAKRGIDVPEGSKKDEIIALLTANDEAKG